MSNPRIATDESLAKHTTEVVKALAHPIRLRIVAMLLEREHTVKELAQRLGETSAVVSQQLRILRMNNLVEAQRDGQGAHYNIAEPRLAQLIACLEGCERKK